MTATKKLFHAIVVIGMASAGAACSSGTTDPPKDASTGSDATNDASSTKDVAVADTGGNTDAGGDGMPAWLGC